jgi:hypothetical protein
MKFRKIDTIIIVALIVVSTLFLYKADYMSSFLPSDNQTPPDAGDNTTTTLSREKLPTPPNSLIPAYRRDVSSEDEGLHFNELRISREWWYFNVFFNEPGSDLSNWSMVVSFNKMAF